MRKAAQIIFAHEQSKEFKILFPEIDNVPEELYKYKKVVLLRAAGFQNKRDMFEEIERRKKTLGYV